MTQCDGYGNWCCLCTKSKDFIKTCLDNTTTSNSNSNTMKMNNTNICDTIHDKKAQITWLLSASCCIDNTTNTITTYNTNNNNNTTTINDNHIFQCMNRSFNLYDVVKDYINDYNYNNHNILSSSLTTSPLSLSKYNINDDLLLNSFIVSLLSLAIIIYIIIYIKV
jgi:hypothetical protein